MKTECVGKKKTRDEKFNDSQKKWDRSTKRGKVF